jgi:zinc/manganese transport system substrate-binding protein
MRRWEQEAAPLRGVRVVSHHESWTYLYDWLGMQEVGTLEPKPGLPPTASHLARLKDDLAKQPARLIIRTAYQDARPSEWLSKQTGIPMVMLPGTVGGTDRAKDLFGLFDDTIDRLVKALH